MLALKTLALFGSIIASLLLLGSALAFNLNDNFSGFSLPSNFGSIQDLKFAADRTTNSLNYGGAALITAANFGSGLKSRLALYVVLSNIQDLRPAASWVDPVSTLNDAPVVELAFFNTYGLVAYISYPGYNTINVCSFSFSGSASAPLVTATYVQNVTISTNVVTFYFDPSYPLLFAAGLDGSVSTYNISIPTNIKLVTKITTAFQFSGQKSLLSVGSDLFLANTRCRAGCEGVSSADFGSGAPQAVNMSPSPRQWAVSKGYSQSYYRMCVAKYVMDSQRRVFVSLASTSVSANGSVVALLSSSPNLNKLISNTAMYDGFSLNDYLFLADPSLGIRVFQISQNSGTTPQSPFPYSLSEQMLTYNGQYFSSSSFRPVAMFLIYDKIYTILTTGVVKIFKFDNPWWDSSYTLTIADVVTQDLEFSIRSNRIAQPPALQYINSAPIVIDAYLLPPLTSSQLSVSDPGRSWRWSNVSYTITNITKTNDMFYRYDKVSQSWSSIPIVSQMQRFTQSDVDDGLIALYPNSQYLTECQTNCLVNSYSAMFQFSATDDWGRTLNDVQVPYSVVCCNSNVSTVDLTAVNVSSVLTGASNSTSVCSVAKPGYYRNPTTGSFSPCPLGTYNPYASASSAGDACISCPLGATTATAGSTSFSQCYCVGSSNCYLSTIQAADVSPAAYPLASPAADSFRPQLLVFTGTQAQYCGFRFQDNATNPTSTLDLYVSNQCNQFRYLYNSIELKSESIGLASANWNTTFFAYLNGSQAVAGAISPNVSLKSTNLLRQLATYILQGNRVPLPNLAGYISNQALPSTIKAASISILAMGWLVTSPSAATQTLYDAYAYNMGDLVDSLANPTANYLISNATATTNSMGLNRIVLPWYTFRGLTFTLMNGSYSANWLTAAGYTYDFTASTSQLANFGAGFYKAVNGDPSQLVQVYRFTGAELISSSIVFLAPPLLFSSNIAFVFSASHSEARFSSLISSSLTASLTGQYIAPPSSGNTPSSQSSDSSTTSGGSSSLVAIIGGSVAAVFGICFLVIAGLVIARRRRQKQLAVSSPTAGAADINSTGSKSFMSSTNSLAFANASSMKPNASVSSLNSAARTNTTTASSLPRSGSHNVLYNFRPTTPGSISKSTLPHSSSHQSLSYQSAVRNPSANTTLKRNQNAVSILGAAGNLTKTYFTPGQTVLAFPAFLEIDYASGLCVGTKIAEGGFAVLCQGELVDDSVVSSQSTEFSKYVAIKVFKRRDSDSRINGVTESTMYPDKSKEKAAFEQDIVGEMENEAAVLYALQNCPNIVKLIAVTKEPRLSLVMRLYDESLSTLVRKDTSVLRESVLQATNYSNVRLTAYVLHDIATGLLAIHNIGVAHLDIKPGNMLVERLSGESNDGNSAVFPFRVVICDFGLARVVNQVNAVRSKPRKLANGISTRYAPPEAFSVVRLIDQNSIINPKSFYKMDIYSLSSTIYEVLTGTIPFAEKADYEIEVALLRGERPPLEQQLVPIYGDRPLTAKDQEVFEMVASFITKGWLANPEIRPTALNQVECANEIMERLNE